MKTLSPRTMTPHLNSTSPKTSTREDECYILREGVELVTLACLEMELFPSYIGGSHTLLGPKWRPIFLEPTSSMDRCHIERVRQWGP